MMTKSIFTSTIVLCFLLTFFVIHPMANQTSTITTDAGVISLNMPKVPVVDALRMIARLMELNIIIDSSVEGTVNLYFDEVPWQDAWQAILETTNLVSEDRNGFYYIHPIQKVETLQEPIGIQVIQLKHIVLGSQGLTKGSSLSQGGSRADTSANISSSVSNQGTSDGGRNQTDTSILEILNQVFEERGLKASIDERSNQLILSAPNSVLQEAVTLVEALDRPLEQILIEAKVLQVKTQVLDQLGVDWGGIYTINNQGTFNLSVDRSRSNSTITETGGESGTFSGNLNNFNITVSALVDQGDARILSTPRVVTQTNREAFISSGQEIQVPSGLDINGNATFRERKVTLELGVTPRVLSNSMINMIIRLRNDSINYALQQISGVPPLDISSVESNVTLKNLETVIIGGIIVKQNNVSSTRIPFFSDIPLIGKVFQHNRTQTDNSELLIMITPTIMDENMKLSQPTSLESFPSSIIQEATQDQSSHKRLQKGSKIFFGGIR